MLSKNTFQFLEDLAEHNYKEWFHENRPRYLESKQEFEALVGELILNLSDLDPDLNSLLPKDCIFRINRDIRFSKDKRTYKANFGAYIAPGGRKSSRAAYYVHIEPKKSFLAGGVYCPSGENLKLIREAIQYDLKTYENIIGKKSFKELFGEVMGDKLKVAPKGFDKNSVGIEYLKLKSHTLIHPVKDGFFIADNVLLKARDIFSEMKEFNDFLNKALDY
ncbi:MAG: TIGR02453 family protein [Marinilabiliales bacterium]|nr:MAG: TIGR02453 family protein [Marinilabiliales bacterium]